MFNLKFVIMKKILLLFTLFALAISLNAQSVFTEYFDSATVEMNLEDFNGWYVCGKSGDDLGVSPVIAEDALYFEGYMGSDTGMSVKLDSLVGQEDASKRISTRWAVIDGDTLTPEIGDTMYYAAIVRIGMGSYDSYRDFMSWDGSPGGNWSRGRVFAEVSNSAADVTFAVSKNSSSASNLDQTAHLIEGGVDSDHLIVLSYAWLEGDANDVVTMYVNPDPALPEDEQTNKYVAVDEQSDYNSGTTEMRINVRQRGVGALIGGIRVATSWEFLMTGDPTVNVSLPTVSDISIYAFGNTIMTNRSGFVQVYDITGRKVMSQITSGMMETSLNSGIYIVRFVDNAGEVATRKVVLK